MTYSRGRSDRGSMSLGEIGGILFALLFVGGLIWGAYWEFGPKQGLHDKTITVCSVEDSTTKDGHQYRVYASDDTYKMEDSWLGVKRRNTATAYGQMKREVSAGAVTYDVTVKGERWNTPTNFENIVKFTRATVQTPEKCAASN